MEYHGLLDGLMVSREFTRMLSVNQRKKEGKTCPPSFIKQKQKKNKPKERTPVSKLRCRTRAGHDSPFWTLLTGGCIKSLNGPRASFRAELTSEEEQVMHSTRVGYRVITCAQVFPSTFSG